jgi:hypothetical protein
MSTFTSSFGPQIEAMLAWRTSLGHSPRDLRTALASFDRFCTTHQPGHSVLTRELAAAWCQDTPAGTWSAGRSRAVREFGKYLQLTGENAFVVPSAWIGQPVRSLPRMLTDQELAAFFRAADTVTAEYRSPFREYTIPVIFRLILSAGLRPPEAPAAPRPRGHHQRGDHDRAVQAQQGPPHSRRARPCRAAGPLRPAG